MIASLIRRVSTPKRTVSTAAGSWRSASRRAGAGCHAARRVTKPTQLLACRLSSPSQASSLATRHLRAARVESSPHLLRSSIRSMPITGTEVTRASSSPACKCSVRRRSRLHRYRSYARVLELGRGTTGRAQLLVHPVTHHVVVSKEMWAGNLESKGLTAVEAEVRRLLMTS